MVRLLLSWGNDEVVAAVVFSKASSIIDSTHLVCSVGLVVAMASSPFLMIVDIARR